MQTITGLCSRCNALRYLRVSSTMREEYKEAGLIKKIKIHAYHCQTCHTFVKCEEINENEECNTQ